MFYVCPFGSWIDKTRSKSVSMMMVKSVHVIVALRLIPWSLFEYEAGMYEVFLILYSGIIISVPLCRLDGILNLLAWQ